MNKQGPNGIEWVNRRLPDGTIRYGYTWNPVSGCFHECKWEMPDGKLAICYAKEVATGLAQAAYPEGFEHHYWHPHRLQEPLRVKDASFIFMDSMSDLMGHWVQADQIEQVFNVCRQAHWHQFQLLTKNAPRLLQFDIPENVWVGASVPPTSINGKELSQQQQARMLETTLNTLRRVETPVRWMSFEPLSWDVSEIVIKYADLEWAVIGAASNGRDLYQPDPAWVRNLIGALRAHGTRIFFKGNLEWTPWLEEFPDYEALIQGHRQWKEGIPNAN